MAISGSKLVVCAGAADEGQRWVSVGISFTGLVELGSARDTANKHRKKRTGTSVQVRYTLDRVLPVRRVVSAVCVTSDHTMCDMTSIVLSL